MGLLDNPSTFAQKYIGHFRKISVTSKKYRNIPERISGAANKCGISTHIFSGLLELSVQVRGALPHPPRSPRGRGAGRI
jgi:hypothetical protein